MRWLTIEHSPAAYRADFYFYGVVSLSIAATLVLIGPPRQQLLAWALTGLLSWSLLEYLLHRFVLHGVPPFKRWHAEHHRRPTALIAAPTLITAAAFSSFLVLPALWWLGAWRAAALSLGVLSGYLLYGLIHHALHHPPRRTLPLRVARWLARRRHLHALHHQQDRSMATPTKHSPTHSIEPGCYGVSSAVWDRTFGTDLTSSACRSTPRERP